MERIHKMHGGKYGEMCRRPAAILRFNRNRLFEHQTKSELREFQRNGLTDGNLIAPVMGLKRRAVK